MLNHRVRDILFHYYVIFQGNVPNQIFEKGTIRLIFLREMQTSDRINRPRAASKPRYRINPNMPRWH